MNTAIGQALVPQTPQRTLAVVVGLATVALDFGIVIYRLDPMCRGAMGIVALGLMVAIADGDLLSLGLRPSPGQGWYWWIRATAIIGAAVAVCISIGVVAMMLAGRPFPMHTTAPNSAANRLLEMCFVYPILEETSYRLVVCVSLIPLIGGWKTIAVSGLCFGALHFAYGNPSPENLVGGFFLAWAFLKSESIVIPLVLHAGGNLVVLVAQIATWRLLAC